MWALFRELISSLPLVLGLISMALLIVLVVIARRLARASEAASDTLDDDASRLEASDEQGEVAVVDFRTSGSLRPIRRSFHQVRRLLQRLLPGPRPRYQTPWFLGLGAAGSGTTTLLHHTQQPLPLGEPDASAGTAPPGVNWWLFDRAVVLDVDGELVLEANGTSSDQPAWHGLLDLLRRQRARRPSDGVLLTLPADELLAFEAADPDAQEGLAARAGVLRRKLLRAQQQLGMQLPVYLVITKCDLVAGFTDFVALLDADQRRQIFGWSSPDPPEVAYNGGLVDTAWHGIEASLARFQLRTAGTASAEAMGSRDMIAFPAALRRLREPVRIYLNQIFSPTAAGEPFPFRGLFFCGGQAGADDGASPHDPPTGGGWTDLVVGSLPMDAHRRVDFVADLVSAKMLYEWNLARPTAFAKRSTRRRVWALQTLLVAGLLLGPLALWGGVRLSGLRAEALDRKMLSPLLGTSRPGEVATGSTAPGAGAPAAGAPATGSTAVGPTAPTSVADLTPEQRADRAIIALDGASRVSAYHLQTTLLPWGLPADLKTRKAMSSVYREAVFPTIQRGLDQQLTQLTLPVALPPPPAKLWSVEEVPELQHLRRHSARLAELEQDVGRFNCFSPAPCAFPSINRPETFRSLVDSLFDTRLRYPNEQARQFYAEIFEQRQAVPYSPETHRAAMQARVLSDSDAMYRRLFDDNALSRDLDALGRQIDLLARQAPANDRVLPTYRRLLTSIETTRRDLARPELAWAGKDTLDLGPAFDAWLKAVIATDLLGRGTAAEIRRRGEARFADWRRQLTAASSVMGPTLVSTEGRAQLQLSPQLDTLGTNLETLLATSFMQPSERLGLRVDPPDGTVLYWRPEPLTKAVAMVQDHTTFSDTTLPAFGPLQSSTNLAARRALEEHLLDQLALAQDFRYQPTPFTRDQKRGALAGQVANLQSVGAALDTLLGAFEPPPPASLASDCAAYCTGRPSTGWCLMSAIVESQQRDLMAGLDDLLREEALYTPSHGDFSWWDGSSDLALQAFGVASQDDLKTYLAVQQARVQSLAQQLAAPVLTTPKNQDCWQFSNLPPYRRFKVVLSDLSDAENKIPNNAVAQLESFVNTAMPAVTLDNCLVAVPSQVGCFAASTAPALRVEPPCDYFLDQRRRLASGITARCRDLTATAAEQGWAAIRRSFDDRLEGKFPFTVEPGEPLKQEATPADVENFFRVFDRHRGLVEGFLSIANRDGSGELVDAGQATWAPDQVLAMQGFMGRMIRVRTFLAPFLEARATSPGALPSFDLQVQFRVNRDHEVAGNQIFAWDFAVAQRQITPGDIDPPGRWTFGQPVQLSLTWATDAPTVPRSPDQANARLVNGQVIYEYRNAWSLVSLLEQHAAPADSFTASVDTDPETLLFAIPTLERPIAPPPPVRPRLRGTVDDGVVLEPDPKAEDSTSSAQPPVELTTKVFLRLTLMSPDGSKAELPFPSFPASVPPFPKPAAP